MFCLSGCFWGDLVLIIAKVTALGTAVEEYRNARRWRHQQCFGGSYFPCWEVAAGTCIPEQNDLQLHLVRKPLAPVFALSFKPSRLVHNLAWKLKICESQCFETDICGVTILFCGGYAQVLLLGHVYRQFLDDLAFGVQAMCSKFLSDGYPLL